MKNVSRRFKDLFIGEWSAIVDSSSPFDVFFSIFMLKHFDTEFVTAQAIEHVVNTMVIFMVFLIVFRRINNKLWLRTFNESKLRYIENFVLQLRDAFMFKAILNIIFSIVVLNQPKSITLFKFWASDTNKSVFTNCVTICPAQIFVGRIKQR